MHTILENYRVLPKEDREYLLQKLTTENERLPDQPGDYDDIKLSYLKGSIDKIPAIKAVRERSLLNGYARLGLKEAKDLVESWR